MSIIEDLYTEMATLSEYEVFRDGFKLGARLVMEAACSKKAEN